MSLWCGWWLGSFLLCGFKNNFHLNAVFLSALFLHSYLLTFLPSYLLSCILPLAFTDITTLPKTPQSYTQPRRPLSPGQKARAVNGLDALRQSTSTFDSSSYQDCADNLSVSRQLLAHFDGYNRIPRVNELRHKMSEIEYHLKSAVRRDLEGLTDSDHLDVMDLELTIQACKVVDALDDLFKQEVVNQFCRGRLDPYEQVCRQCS